MAITTGTWFTRTTTSQGDSPNGWRFTPIASARQIGRLSGEMQRDAVKIEEIKCTANGNRETAREP